MAWWRSRVVAPAHRAWRAVAVAVAARARGRKGANTESAGIVGLHRDVQTCGYHDVQVMWDMLGLDTAPPCAPERRNPSPFWTPSFWHLRLRPSSRRTAAAR